MTCSRQCFGTRELVFGEHLFQPSDHSARFSLEKHSQPFSHEFPGLESPLVIEAKSGFAQMFQDVKDVQHEEGCGDHPIVQDFSL
jgi:hypothetical protein